MMKEMLSLSSVTVLALVTGLPATTSTLMNQIEQQQGEPANSGSQGED